MLWSYLKSVVLGVLGIVFLVLIVEVVFSLFPKPFLVFVGVGVVWFIYWTIKESYKNHKYYVENIKPGEDSYDNVMREYWKACRKTAWADLKKSWAEYRGKKTTP